MPTNDKTKELSPETKLTIIIDTARLNETELAEYCRSKGLYPEQIAQWKAQSLTGFSTSEQQTVLNRKQQQADHRFFHLNGTEQIAMRLGPVARI